MNEKVMPFQVGKKIKKTKKEEFEYDSMSEVERKQISS